MNQLDRLVKYSHTYNGGLRASDQLNDVIEEIFLFIKKNKITSTNIMSNNNFKGLYNIVKKAENQKTGHGTKFELNEEDKRNIEKSTGKERVSFLFDGIKNKINEYLSHELYYDNNSKLSWNKELGFLIDKIQGKNVFRDNYVTTETDRYNAIFMQAFEKTNYGPQDGHKDGNNIVRSNKLFAATYAKNLKEPLTGIIKDLKEKGVAPSVDNIIEKFQKSPAYKNNFENYGDNTLKNRIIQEVTKIVREINKNDPSKSQEKTALSVRVGEIGSYSKYISVQFKDSTQMKDFLKNLDNTLVKGRIEDFTPGITKNKNRLQIPLNAFNGYYGVQNLKSIENSLQKINCSVSKPIADIVKENNVSIRRIQ